MNGALQHIDIIMVKENIDMHPLSQVRPEHFVKGFLERIEGKPDQLSELLKAR